MENCKPGVKLASEVIGDGKVLDKRLGSEIRRVIAILNYIAQDRSDLGYAVKECTRSMSCPTTHTEAAVKRSARYLKGCPRRICMYRLQSEPSELHACSDSDWARCVKTRRSTSGGFLLHGAHVVKAWSRTQASVALSSGEAELYALVKASVEMLGLRNLAKEMGLELKGTLYTDSSAAKGAIHR